MIDRKRRRLCYLLGIAVIVGASMSPTATPQPRDANSSQYEAAVASPIRTDQDRRMDAERKPAAFLPFAMVGPGMQVMDVSAGAGYTTQLLALAVGPTGRVWAQAPKAGETLRTRLADPRQANITLVERPFDDPVPEGTPKLDLVTLVLNYHDITYLPVDRAQMNKRLYDALKPGGHYVVIDHSSRSGKGITEGKTLHRIDEAVVLDEVRRAGFVLEAEGDFLRNPADSRDASSNQPKVPTDKFALRFVKPK